MAADLKKLARRKVQYALRSGRISRPMGCLCLGCAACEPSGACIRVYPEHKIEAHHPDYSKPLDVLWLCNPCHKIADDRTQMTPAVTERARALRAQGLSLGYVAKRLGVSIRALRSHLGRA